MSLVALTCFYMPVSTEPPACKVAHVLQTQGCKPVLQETCLLALHTLLSSSTPACFDIALVPDVEEGAWANMQLSSKIACLNFQTRGLLQIRGHQVKQSCWLSFLQHFNLTRRPCNCIHGKNKTSKHLQVASVQDPDPRAATIGDRLALWLQTCCPFPSAVQAFTFLWQSGSFCAFHTTTTTRTRQCPDCVDSSLYSLGT